MYLIFAQRNALIVGQNVTEVIHRSHTEKYSCHVELSTRLESFEQQSDHIVAQLVKTTNAGQEVSETLLVSF
jgi:bacterioferritin (cytochrome b1)